MAAPAAAFGLALAVVAGCAPAPGRPDDAASTAVADVAAAVATAPMATVDTAALRKAVVRTYADIAYAAYGDALGTADDLHETIEAFLDAPTDESLAAAKTAWLAARDAYGQTEVFRFYGGPIDADERGVEGFVNAWPMDEAYLDYVEGDPAAGLVAAAAEHPDLTAKLLLDLNELGGEKNIATGYHAIEFLLWGQDVSADGPGHRPVTDYVVGAGPNAARRRTLLALEADLLVQHLGRVAGAWDADDMAGYRKDFVRDPDAALALVFTGLTALSGEELAGERMAVAYETQDQEDEHSCFSDNTHNDFIAGAKGIANIWTGSYGAVKGTGLGALVAAVDAKQADEVTAQLAVVQAAVAAIPPPFDQAIKGADDAPGRVAVQAAMTALEQLSARLKSAGASLGVVGGGGGA